MRKIHFECSASSPDYQALKAQLGSLPGIYSMDIHSSNGDVTVDYNDHAVTAQQIVKSIYDLGYEQV